MGLDIVIYKEDNGKKIMEIKEKTHKAIFSSQSDLSELAQLSRLKDYYKTNVYLQTEEVNALINDLKLISQQLDHSYGNEIRDIVEELSKPLITKVHIAGD